jgi:A/G-specific adenine glycosylase
LFCIDTKDSSRRSRRFIDLLGKLISLENPRRYNYSLLDLADKICTKKRPPDCGICPLILMCCYGEKHLIDKAITA